VKKYLYTTFIILLLVAIQNIALGQSSYGANFGIVVGNNGNLLNSSGDSIRTYRNGYQIGVKASFGTYSFFIAPSINFKDISISNSFNSVNPFEKTPRLKIMKAKFVIGYQKSIITKKIIFKIGGGLNESLIVSVSDNKEGYSLENLEDKYLAYNIDIGFDIFKFSINLSYEKSLKNIYIANENEHKFDYLILTTGLMF